MRRLVDETTDELTRSLLSAGIEHQPPPGNKARVILALGAGGALGLFSSNALAWLSTTTGKVTALGVAVGVAGAVWVAVPPAHEARSSNAGAKVAALPQPAVSNDVAGSNDLAGGPAPADGSSTAGDASNAGSEVAADAHASSVAPGSSDERREGSAARRGARKHKVKKALAKGKVAAFQPSEQSEGESASLDAPSGGGPLGETPDPGKGELDAVGLDAVSLDAVGLDTVDLDSEVRLVDSMHSAARRNDRAALGRFLERYRAAFPDGQLKKEVAEFAARLDRPDLSSPR